MFKFVWKKLFPSYVGTHYDTVRYAFPLVLFTALIAGFASVITENSSYVTIRSNVETVVQDQPFFIDIRASTHVPVNAVDLVIAYPDSKMVIDSIDTGTSVITLWTQEPYAKNGNIYLSGGTFRKGFIGEHTIARIKAHATQSGEARVLIKETQLVAGDGKGTEVSVVESDTNNEVKIKVEGKDGVISGKATITIISDTDGDGDVDLHDISIFMSAWFTGSKTYDFNGDGRMTISDFSILLADSFFR